MLLMLFKSHEFAFTPEGTYVKVLLVVGKFEGALGTLRMHLNAFGYNVKFASNHLQS